jgi:tetratricopeptide (TPR) repeat protein
MTTYTFFDKPTIIQLMKLAFQRLRAQQILVPDVIAALQKRGITLTRARFDDMFLTRPERDSTAPMAVFVATVDILFGHNPGVWSAEEFMQLAVAVRVPIDQLQQFSVYFSRQTWQSALQLYGFYPPAPSVNAPLIGRDHLLERLRDVMLQRQHVVLVGTAGIGKTAIALELMRQYEITQGQRTYYFDLSTVTSLGNLYQQLALTFQIKPLANEPIVLRLKMVLEMQSSYVLIDNADEQNPMAPAMVIRQMMQQFPSLRFVITSRMYQLAELIGVAQSVVIPPLQMDHERAAACQLFMRVFQQAGGRTIDSGYVLRSCRAVEGNPLQIAMIANAVTQQANPISSQDSVALALNNLSPTEMRIVMLLSISRLHIPLRFLQFVSQQLFAVSEYALPSMMDALEQRQVIYQVRSDADLFAVHAVIRQVIQQRMTHDRQYQLLRDLGKATLFIDAKWEDVFQQNNSFVTTTDVVVALHMVELLLASNLVSEAVSILVNWHTLWIRHGLTTDAVSLCERCEVLLPSDHPQRTELVFVLGSLYGNRGVIHLSLTYLRQAFSLAEAHQTQFVWARTAIEYGLNGLHDADAMEKGIFVELCGDLQRAIDYFGQSNANTWQARALDMLAFMHFTVGNLRQALEYNDNAMTMFRDAGVTIGLLDAAYNRGLILMAVGDFASARTYLNYARQEFQRIAMPINMANCHLRLAAISVLADDVHDTRTNLVETFRVLHRAGGMQDMLYIMDIYSALQMRIGNAHETLVLSALCQQFREERRLYRGAMLDQMVEQQLQMARNTVVQMQQQASMFNMHMTFYDVIGVIRDDLLGRNGA